MILVLRALGLGDFLTGVPAYRGLRRAFPGHELLLAAPAPLAALTPLTGAIDALIPTPGLEPIDAPTPDVAVNLHGRGPQSHRLLDALNPLRRIGFDADGWDGPEWSDDEHETDRWCRLLAHHGIAADPVDLWLPRPGSSPAPGAVVIHPGAAFGCRRWPVDRFAAVARHLAAGGHRVVVTGGAGERALARRVASGAGEDAGAMDLRRLAALVAGAALVICGDTGVAHLATAFGTPSVLLFGPTPPSRWGPRTSGPHRVLWHPEHGCGDPRGKVPGPALLAITPAEVLAAAEQLLDTRSVG